MKSVLNAFETHFIPVSNAFNTHLKRILNEFKTRFKRVQNVFEKVVANKAEAKHLLYVVRII